MLKLIIMFSNKNIYIEDDKISFLTIKMAIEELKLL